MPPTAGPPATDALRSRRRSRPLRARAAAPSRPHRDPRRRDRRPAIPGRPHHRLLDGHRTRNGGAPRRARAGGSTPRRGVPSRSPTSSRQGCRTLALDVTRRELDARGCRRRRSRTRSRRRAGQQRRVRRRGRGRDHRRWTRSAGSSRRTSSASSGCASSSFPGCDRRRWGRIVNISSVGGKLTFPGGAYYHATKHAVEAFSDALRFEVARFGVHVVVVEPGLIKTAFGDTATAASYRPTPGRTRSSTKPSRSGSAGAYEGLMGRSAAPSDRKPSPRSSSARSRRIVPEHAIPRHVGRPLHRSRRASSLPDRVLGRVHARRSSRGPSRPTEPVTPRLVSCSSSQPVFAVG